MGSVFKNIIFVQHAGLSTIDYKDSIDAASGDNHFIVMLNTWIVNKLSFAHQFHKLKVI